MIYKEIEETDKVAGRVRTVSQGMFSNNEFELLSLFCDPEQISDTKISGWWNATENIAEEPPHKASDEEDFGSNIPNPTQYETINLQTQTGNEENWTQVTNGDYYVNVYDKQPTIAGRRNPEAEIQFSIAYGQVHGWGSLNDVKSTKITKAIYNQYKNILLGPGDSRFTFTQKGKMAGVHSDSIYVINFTSKRLREKFDEGNLEFSLSVQQGNIQVTQTFRDSSKFESELPSFTSSNSSQFGRVFNIVKGSVLDSELSDSQLYDPRSVVEGGGQNFGLAYPDLGIVVLNPNALSNEFSELLNTESINNVDGEAPDDWPEQGLNAGDKLAWYGDIPPTDDMLIKFEDEGIAPGSLASGTERNHQNFMRLFKSLKSGGKFWARSTELIPSKHYFIRIKNTDFNYSNNPSFIYNNAEAREIASTDLRTKDYWFGRLRHENFINDPKVYVTTIGLYNENNDLVAVAKLSNPILKSFDSEALIKVKLDF
jgi:hypothetical protein